MSVLTNIEKTRRYIKFDNQIFALFIVFIISFLVIIYIFFISNIIYTNNIDNRVVENKINFSTSVLYKNKSTNYSCDIFTCLNVYRCGSKGNQLLVYVYPHKMFSSSVKLLQNNYMTKESQLILQAITTSKYYTSNPNDACIFISFTDTYDLDKRNIWSSPTLNMFQFSERGENHLIFNLRLENLKKLNDFVHTSQAMFAGMGYTKLFYRKKFDISLPTLSILLEQFHSSQSISRKWLVTSSQVNIIPDITKSLLEMQKLFPEYLQILYACPTNKTNQSLRCTHLNSFNYPEILQSSIFCLVVRGEKLGLSVLLEALAAQCIPVIVFDSLVMPFNEVIDWSRAAIFIRELDILFAVNFLKNYSSYRIRELQSHGSWLYVKYFHSIKTITETALTIISDRIFPHSARNYYFWNEPEYQEVSSPVFLPMTIPKNDGFTAVILTYDRIDLLFLLIHKLSKVPSLTKILIVWNNQYKKPPILAKWPKIYKLMKIIPTAKNILSNRFYPFEEIETEAVLSIDDDIIMLTEDEIEFAFEVWREFPDRIVGFPSRTHTWDNKTLCWRYESEWTNQISMVLTGAAFYHKYWNYAYTTKLPENIKEWVDKHMNCEDIAMNFLIANITKKAPIKVTAKKKFRCPECINTEMLSADLTHMAERTQCINQFSKVFGYMPLLSVEFRADPVLFKDNFPDKLKRFNNVGSL